VKNLLTAFTALLLLVLAVVELYRAGLVRFNYPDPEHFPVQGIDVSHHQAEIDWSVVKEAGLSFAFIKATEGATHRDTRFDENWKGAGEAGLARGAYHFFTFCTDGAAQAENYLARVAPLDPELPPAVDVEFSGNCRGWESVDEIRGELEVFLERIESGIGRKPILYYTSEAARKIIGDRFHGYPRWPRSLLGQPSQRVAPWAFWQYADNGRIPGIRGAIDLDVFRGGRGDFAVVARPPQQPEIP